MLAQQILNGLTLGAVYTLIALGFSLVMGLLRVLNIAIAELFMIGGYVGLTLAAAGYPAPVALAAAAGASALLGVVVEKVGVQPLRNAPPVTPLLSTLGFSIIFQSAVGNIWGSDPLQMPPGFMDARISLGPMSVGVVQLVVIGTAGLFVAGVALTVRRTWLGRGLRAVAENRPVARLLGVPAERLTTAAFALSGALAGVAGFLIGLHYAAITPLIGVETGLKAVAVMVIGGTTNIWGVLLAGPLVGIAEVFTVVYGGSAFRDIVVYGLMILTLLLRPQGLLGSRGDTATRV